MGMPRLVSPPSRGRLGALRGDDWERFAGTTGSAQADYVIVAYSDFRRLAGD